MVARLRRAGTTRFKPKDVERASGVKLLPPDDPEVESKPRKSNAGKPLSPVLLIRGEHDGIASLDDLLEFYKKLPNPDRQFSILSGAAHALALSLDREQFWHVVHAFLTIPTRAGT